MSGTVVFDPQAILCTLRYASRALDIARLACLHAGTQAVERATNGELVDDDIAAERANADLAYDTAAKLAHGIGLVAGSIVDWEIK